MDSHTQKSKSTECADARICFVQLTRMGDILQTYRVASSFKKYHPQAKLYLVARKKFAFHLSFLLEQCFDEIFLLDVETMVEYVENTDDLIKRVSGVLENINSNKIDTLFNLSWSRSSEYICSLIRADKKFGLLKNENNQTVAEDKWSQLVYSMVMRGDICPYNIVDIYKAIVGVERISVVSNTSEVVVQKQIVVHPFASSAKKHWKHSKWVEVIYKVLKTNSEHEIVIVGSEDERETIERMLEAPVLSRFKGRIYSKVDEGGISDLLNVLRCSELFIGHDSFVSHLAALTDIPIVTLALGTVRICETAPYSPRAYILAPRTSCYPCFPEEKCDYYKCHADIPYQVVVGMVNMILREENINNVSLNKEITKFLMSSVDVFKTSFGDSDFLRFERVSDSDLCLKDIFMMFYRITYLCFFEMPEEKATIPELNRKTTNELKEVMEGLEYAYDLYRFGKMYSKEIIEAIGTGTPCVEKLQSCSDNIDEIDRLQDLLGKRYPVLRPMIDFFIVARKNIKGDNIVEISEGSFYTYHGSSIFTSMIYDLCKKTVSRNESHVLEENKNV